MLESGVNLKTVSAALGHKTIQMTGDVYAHVIETVQQSAADRLNRIIGSGLRAARIVSDGSVSELGDQIVTSRPISRTDLRSDDGGEGGSRTHMSCLGRF